MPVAIRVNCPIDTFWNDDPIYFWAYLKAYNEQLKEQQKQYIDFIETISWTNGIYVLHAIASTFGKDKYPQKPIKVMETNEISSENTKENQEKQVLAKYLAFKNYVDAYNSTKHKE